MPKFELEQRIPSCLVTKDLLSAIEKYLKVDMPERLGDLIGDKVSYKISIKENIGTETLKSVAEFTPSSFSDGTKRVQIRWRNSQDTPCELDLTIDFDKFYSVSNLRIECIAPTARETAIGIKEAILRVLESNRNYNWILNPFKIPIVSILSAATGIGLLYLAAMSLQTDQQQGIYLLCGAAFAGWVYCSADYFRPVISFDSRRQRLLDKLWRYFSLGIFGFILFGTLLPFLRKVLFGF